MAKMLLLIFPAKVFLDQGDFLATLSVKPLANLKPDPVYSTGWQTVLQCMAITWPME
jgi:hypothetical protein